MSASCDCQVLPALLGCSTVHVILPSRTDHNIALIHHDTFTVQFNKSLPRNTDNDLSLVMAVCRCLSAGCDFHNTNIQFIVGGGALNPRQVKTWGARCMHTFGAQELCGPNVPHYKGQG